MQPLHDRGRRRAVSIRVAQHLSVWLIGAGLWTGCDSWRPPATFEATTDPAKLFMALTLDHRAVNLSTVAPYDTVRLRATPRDGLGEAMTGLPEAAFRSLDTAAVWVTTDGLLQARRPATGVQVIAEIVAEGNVRHADTAFVNVIADADPPKLATFSIKPQQPDDAVWAVLPRYGVVGQLLLEQIAGIRVWPVLTLRALDDNGDPVKGLEIEYWSLDPKIAEIDRRSGAVTKVHAPGEVGIVARTMAYGAHRADTAYFTVTLPFVHGIQINDWTDGKLVMTPSEVMIRPGGYVIWVNFSWTPVDITFDDPTNVEGLAEVCAILGGAFCDGGDIAPFDGSTNELMDAVRGRRFPVPGSYRFSSSLTGLSGRVIVAEDPTSITGMQP